MPLVILPFLLVFFPLNILRVHSSAPGPGSRDTDTNTILPGQSLAGDDKLVCSTGKYALGFFQTQTSHYSSRYYLGIWINRVPTMTPVWVANEDDPIADLTAAVLTISPDGNLAVVNRVTSSIIWSTSTQANTTTSNDTIATLTDGGNLILQLQRSSSSSLSDDDVLWQSFDHPTNSLLPGAKLGRDKVTGGLNRRLVSRKSSADQAPGAYALELDPAGAAQFILVELNSGVTYWSSGVWNGRFFNSIPDMGAFSEFINNGTEEYLVAPLPDDSMIMHLSLDVSGQLKAFIWYEQLQDWMIAAVQPKSQCDVYAVCGSYSVCNDNVSPSCNCMKGFSIASPEDWELEDRRGGCVRNSPLDCSDSKARGSSSSTDGFYSIPCSGLPPNAQRLSGVIIPNEGECAKVCLGNCSCTAYSFGDYGCYVWHDELFSVRQQQYSDLTSTKVEFLKVRLAAKDLRVLENHRRKLLVWVVTSATILALLGFVSLLIVWRNRILMRYRRVANGVQGGNGIVAFRYTDLQQATQGFSAKLGSGGFGSVYKGVLPDGSIIAVKMLDGLRQGEKHFRAEVSSVGMIQHVNLVKLIGFCCEGNKRLLVYECLTYGSLDAHLYQNSVTFLNWKNRYQIALGVARGLAYLHERCQECIIHCDIKPENILLDASFTPRIADFGMAKLVQRNLGGVLTTMRGTVGYLAPEWLSGVAITTKVDVYSYGMVLLEIISGRRNTSEQCTSGHSDAYFPLQAAHNLLKGDVQSLVDPKLSGDANMEEVERACKAACWCIQDKESDRPSMGEIVQILEGLREVDVPPLPKMLQAVAGSPLSTICKLHYFD